jgi:Mn2+/Fe2+ NRAMP family transporter
MIVGEQRAVMITAVSAAVGINMTFLMPYSLLKRGWDKDFRGLAIFDLSFGMFIPFVLATSCVMIASAAQFHTQPAAGLLGEKDATEQAIKAPANLKANYIKNAEARVRSEMGEEAFAELSDYEKVEKLESLPAADKRMAAMLVRRDSFNLADSLSPLTGPAIAHYAFGIGVVGMGVSSIIIMMLINGFVLCEILGVESKGWAYRIGSFMPGLGAMAPFVWTGGKVQFWLAVPAFVFGMMILPIAYSTFYLMMNSKSLMGESMPRGGRRVAWNVLMGIASGLAAFGAIWSLWSRLGKVGILLMVVFVGLAAAVGIARSKLHEKEH